MKNSLTQRWRFNTGGTQNTASCSDWDYTGFVIYYIVLQCMYCISMQLFSLLSDDWCPEGACNSDVGFCCTCWDESNLWLMTVRTKTFVPVIPIHQMSEDEINPLIWNDTLAEKVTVLLKLILFNCLYFNYHKLETRNICHFIERS